MTDPETAQEELIEIPDDAEEPVIDAFSEEATEEGWYESEDSFEEADEYVFEPDEPVGLSEAPFSDLEIRNAAYDVITPGKTLTLTCKTDTAYVPRTAELDWFFTAHGADPDDEDNRIRENDTYKIANGKLTAKSALREYAAAETIDVYVRYKAADVLSDPKEITAYPAAVSSIRCSPLTMHMAGATEQLIVSTQPDTACPDGLTYKSSNARVITVDETGLVTAVGNGTAYVTVTAGDNSRKNARVKVTVAQKPRSVSISTAGDQVIVGAGKSLQFKAAVNAQPGEYPAAKTGVNWKITAISEAGGSAVSPDQFQNIATVTAKGLCKVKQITKAYKLTMQAACVADSSVKADKEITLYPLTTALKLEDCASGATTKLSMQMSSDIPVGERRISFTIGTQERTGCDFTVSSSGKEGMTVGDAYTVTSSRPAVASVTPLYQEGDTVREWQVRAVSKGNCVIKVTAADGSGKSQSIAVSVVRPVTGIEIGTKTGAHDLAGNCKLQLSAVTNADASDKSVVWKIEKVIRNKDGCEESAYGRIVSLTAKGLLQAGDLNTQYTVTVSATAADGSGTRNEADITLYPQAVAYQITSDPVEHVSSMLAGGEVRLKIRALSLDEQNRGSGYDPLTECAAQRFRVSYTMGAASVTVLNSLGNEVSVTGIKKGSTTVTFTALDGTGKKTSYKITVLSNDKRGWITIDGAQYYLDPATGLLATGFRVIDDRLYYFLEEGVKGALAKGLFYVPVTGAQYDDAEHASNRYYAYEKDTTEGGYTYKAGEVSAVDGWMEIRKEQGVKNTQEWSYYFAGRELTVDGKTCVIGEALAGDWLIDTSGAERELTYVPDISAVTDAAARAKIYSFHPVTGARKRTALYFFG
ncbi:MAG: Ig-like domain-containing protein, partial [Lachnospiraceae bacterium]|nr:Ig-like domain-containing protein [Lachnospiraceae bacterium]